MSQHQGTRDAEALLLPPGETMCRIIKAVVYLVPEATR